MSSAVERPQIARPAGKAAMLLRHHDSLHRSEYQIFLKLKIIFLVYIDSIIRNARGHFPELASVHGGGLERSEGDSIRVTFQLASESRPGSHSSHELARIRVTSWLASHACPGSHPGHVPARIPVRFTSWLASESRPGSHPGHVLVRNRVTSEFAASGLADLGQVDRAGSSSVQPSSTST